MWLLVALGSFWFGALCLVPSQTMIVVLYRNALGVMPQQAWGALLLFHAIASLAYVCCYHKRWLGISVSALGLGVWFLLIGAVLNTLHSWMPLAGEMVLGVSSLFLFIRALTDD